MSDPIIFYDIPGNAPACKAWSPNTWKARFALNIKGIPYRTEWVEYPDIGQVFERHGIPAVHKNDDGSPYYTLPVIHDPSTGITTADSTAIAKYLDKTYPDTHVLFPRGTLAFHAAFNAAQWTVHMALFDIVVCAVCYCLNPRSQEYFRRTREEEEGKKLEDIRTEEAWATLEEAYGKLAKWLSANEEGKDDLVMGDRLCYADVIIVSTLMWAKVPLGEDSKEWARICGWHGGKWKRLVDNFAKYTYVD